VRLHPWFILSLALALAPIGCDRGGGSQVAPGPAAPGQPGPGQPGPGQAAADPAAPQGAAAAGEVAPQALMFANDPGVYTKGVAIAPNPPFTSGGRPTSYRVRPALPAGLVLDPGTGVISGTPTAVTPQASYEITAGNSAGTATASLTLAVNDQAPAAAPVVALPRFVTAGADGVAATTQDRGKGWTYAWTVRGGSLSAGQGTPAATLKAGSDGLLTAQVTVANSGGGLSGQAEATIVPRPEATMTFPVQVAAGRSGLSASVTAQPGMTYAWTVLPGSASATLTSGQDSTTVGFSAGPTPGSFQLKLTVQNQAGFQAYAIADIKVQ